MIDVFTIGAESHELILHDLHVRVDDDPAPLLQPFGDIDGREENAIQDYQVIWLVDLAPLADLAIRGAREGHHGGAPALHPEGRKRLHELPLVEKSVRQDLRGDHRSLASPAMGPDFQHILSLSSESTGTRFCEYF
jgi:hypothetical protein